MMFCYQKPTTSQNQAAKLQTNIFKNFFIGGKCNWNDAKITDICPPVLAQEFQNPPMLPNLFLSPDLRISVRLCYTVFNKILKHKVNLLNLLYTNMPMHHFSKHYTTGIPNVCFQYTQLVRNNYKIYPHQPVPSCPPA